MLTDEQGVVVVAEDAQMKSAVFCLLPACSLLVEEGLLTRN